MSDADHSFSVEYLPGQFDQRADSAEQCVRFIKEDETPVIHTATTYVIEGTISEEEFAAIKNHCINPVDSREAGEEKPETLVTVFDDPEDVIVFEGFKEMKEDELEKLYSSLGLAMTFKDFLHIRNYYKDEEHRDPTMTEIRVLDTYWSDHCRHTTFSTELKEVSFNEGFYKKPIEDTYKAYLKDHSEIFAGREDKFVCLMDLALMAMRRLKKEGKLQDQEKSDEINACSIVVPIIQTLLLTVIALSIERYFAIRSAFGKGSLVKFVANIKSALATGDMKKAQELCDKQGGSVANVVTSTLKKYAEVENDETLSKDQKVLAIQKELEEATALELPMMEQNLPIIGTITTLGTLMGLLGTVIGMIRSFAALSAGGGTDSMALSQGISEALINTAFGILTGALAVIAYNYYTNKIDKLTYSLDEVGFSIVQTFAASHK